MKKEVERSWLMKENTIGQLDQVFPIKHEYLTEQFFLVSGCTNICLTKVTDESNFGIHYYLSIKENGHLSSLKNQYQISADLYERLSNAIGEPTPIRKICRTYILPGTDLLLEVSAIDDSFVHASILFQDMFQSVYFMPGNFIAFNRLVIEEITGNFKHCLRNYWNRTRNIPEELQKTMEEFQETDSNIRF